MTTLLITGGRVLDPASGFDQVADVAVADGRVVEIGPSLLRQPAARVIDAAGRIVCPGLIDPHVHLREPGQEHKETIETGSLAAIAGGFTTVCCMPNTTPAIDSPELVRFVADRARTAARCRVFAVAAATRGRQGVEPTEFRLLAQASAVAFSDDGDVVASARVMLDLMREIAPLGLCFMQHCQEPTLTRGASMHAGDVSTRLGLVGWPRVAEEIIIERDVRLVAESGCRYHVQHLSSGGSVEIVRRAQAAGLPVTAEASPHHLLLTHEAIAVGPASSRCENHRHLEDGSAGAHRLEAGATRYTHRLEAGATRYAHRLEAGATSAHRLEAGAAGYNTNAKMNPPLREQSDIDAIRAGVADGTITVLATDHAPHTPDEKAQPFEDAPFGIIGLETALPLYAEALVHSGVIDWPRLLAMLTIEPARLCNLDRAHRQNDALGELFPGGPADITIIDPDAEWAITEDTLAGKSVNTPFLGRTVRGRAVATIVGGEVVMEHNSSIHALPSE